MTDSLWLSTCSQRILPEPSPGFVEALAQLDTNAVKADITALLTSSEEFWPADYGQRQHPRLRRDSVWLLKAEPQHPLLQATTWVSLSVSRGTVPAHTG